MRRRVVLGGVGLRERLGSCREIRIEAWSEDNTGGRMECSEVSVEGMKARSMVDGVPEWE